MIEDARLRAHRDRVRALMKPGQPLAVDSPYATVNILAWFAAPTRPRLARERLHEELVARALGDRFPAVGRGRPAAIVLAGPPGAGKGTMRRQLLGSEADSWLVIDADDFKRALLTTALEDGTYDRVIMPPEIRAAREAGEPFAPLELAPLVHEESSMLAHELRTAAIGRRLDIVLDTVLSGPRAAADIGRRLDAAGYDVRVVDLEASQEISALRVEQRWTQVMREYDNASTDATSLGGRWVPSEYVAGLYPARLGGASVCEENARELASSCAAVVRYDVLRVVDANAAPQQEVALGRSRRGAPLVAATAATAARRASGVSVAPALER